MAMLHLQSSANLLVFAQVSIAFKQFNSLFSVLSSALPQDHPESSAKHRHALKYSHPTFYAFAGD